MSQTIFECDPEQKIITGNAQCAPEPLFTTFTRIFTQYGETKLSNTKPRTKSQIDKDIESLRTIGLILATSDGYRTTAYLPHAIYKVVVELTPYKEKSDQDQ